MDGKVAAVIFVNEENEILLYLRDNNPSIPYPNTWALIGGHIEKGETPLLALKREVKEEIGYEIKKPVFIDTFDDLAGNLVYIYVAKISKKIEELFLTEGQKLRYFNLKELLELDILPHFKDFFIRHENKIFYKN